MKFSLIIASTICLTLTNTLTAQTDGSTSTKKEIRKTKFSEKHAFDSKSYFVELNGGRFLTQTKEVGGEDFFENEWAESLVSNLSLEKGLSNYYYLKGNLSYANYSMRVRVNDANVASVHFPFKAIGLSFGFGKRLIFKNNFNLLNVEAGLGINGHTAKTGLTNESFGSARFTDTGDTVYIFNSKSYVDTKLFPTLYLGASKDFRLAKTFYLSLAYRFNIGMTTVAHQDLFFSDDQNTNTPTKVVANGTSHAITLGVKYRFDCGR